MYLDTHERKCDITVILSTLSLIRDVPDFMNNKMGIFVFRLTIYETVWQMDPEYNDKEDSRQFGRDKWGTGMEYETESPFKLFCLPFGTGTFYRC